MIIEVISIDEVASGILKRQNLLIFELSSGLFSAKATE
jgi:hypothetical protein